MNSPARIALAISLALGVGAGASGYWFGTLQRPTAMPALPSYMAPPSPDEEAARLRNEIKMLLAENAKLAAAPKPPTSASIHAPPETPPPVTSSALELASDESTRWFRLTESAPADLLGFLAEIHRRRLGQVELPLVDREGRLTAGFVQLFGVKLHEAQRLQAALDDARWQSDLLALDHATLQEVAGQMVIRVAPFEGGVDIYARMMGAFAESLGPDRYVAFSTLAADQLSAVLQGFGAQRRTITIGRVAPVHDRRTLYQVNDQREFVQGNKLPPKSIAERNDNVTLDFILERYGWFASRSAVLNRLPAGARGPAKNAVTLRTM